MRHDPRTVFLTGAIMVVTGVALFVPQIAGARWIYPWIPVITGAALLSAGFVARISGFFLPGALIAGAGTGILIAGRLPEGAGETAETAVLMLCIGAGLVAAPVLVRLSRESPRLWPLVPGGALVAIGLMVLLTGGSP